MKTFSQIKEIVSISIIRTILKIFYIFPIYKKKIFFSSYEGKQFSCNPKYIYLKLRELQGKKCKYVYEYNFSDVLDEIEKDTIVVKHNTVPYFLHLMTSKIIVTNSGITAKIPIRKSQVLINTWHGGGAYKKCGKDIDPEMNGSGTQYIKISEKQTTYFLSSSRRFSEVMHSGLEIPFTKMVNCGMPRNDLFFLPPLEREERIREIRNNLGLADGCKIVLYAPTYRGNAGHAQDAPEDLLNIPLILQALQKRNGGCWKFLFRVHYYNMDHFSVKEELIKDVSNYPDMQELLLISDVLITDYSSSVWDFSFTKNQGYLFVPDLKDYEKSRNFYTPIEDWPYEKAETTSELIEKILEYDHERQEKKKKHHHTLLGNYEKGDATRQVCDLILRELKES